MKEQTSTSWTSRSLSAALRAISRLNLAFLLTSLTIITLSLSDRYASSVARSIKLEQQLASRHDDHIWLSAYVTWHAKNRNASRVLLFRPTGEDVGRDIRYMIDLYAVAVLTNRVFLVNWTAAQPIADGISRRAYSRFVVDQTTVSATVLRSTRYGDVLQTLRGPTEVVAVDSTHRSFVETFVLEFRDVIWRDGKVDRFSNAVRRDVARMLLEPSEDMTEMIRTLKARVGLCVARRRFRLFSWMRRSCAADTRRYISVYANSHSRQQIHGTTVDQDTIFVGCVTKHVKTIVASMGAIKVRVFVVSDERFLNTLKAQLLRSVPKADVVHLEDLNYSGVDDKGRMMWKHVQMRIVGNAEHIISVDSGFAKAAFLIGNALSSTVISPYFCGL